MATGKTSTLTFRIAPALKEALRMAAGHGLVAYPHAAVEIQDELVVRPDERRDRHEYSFPPCAEPPSQ